MKKKITDILYFLITLYSITFSCEKNSLDTSQVLSVVVLDFDLIYKQNESRNTWRISYFFSPFLVLIWIN